MIAVQDFEWDGVEHTVGQRFDVAPVEASVLRRRRQARFVTGDDPIDEPIPPPVIETAKEATVTVRRPRRKRRDIARAEHTKGDA
jgi:hypothetical protein